MAEICPFRGVRYNPARFSKLDVVVSQPYDRVRYGLQEKYYELSPYNIVRIIKNKEEPGDDEHHNVYTRARDHYYQWLNEGILVREAQPALYVYHQEFTINGVQRVRKAFIAALKLVEFDEGTVLPHERTLAGPKIDRLNLLRATATNFELVFMLYPDPENRVNVLLDAAIADRAPEVDAVELYEKDVRQKMWVVTDPKTIQAVQAAMRPKRNLIIADGHHRYETSLNYRNEMRTAYPDAPPNAAFNYRAVALVSMDDPGLTILPTHREVHDYDVVPADVLLERAASYFEVIPVADQTACLELMARRRNEHAIGFYAAGKYHVLVLRDESLLDQLITEARVAAWKRLDVTILHKLLIEGVAGIDDHLLEQKIRYHRDLQGAVDNVDRGEGEYVFLLNPTRIGEVKACSTQGEKMPQKSTDFYPKMISGLVICPVNADETLC
ncbi:MAG: DUF1015 domain-containing protein [Anaerolineae bacterium]|jgi:uncharacterized protein (DUF1015 family)|nr:DUF1015 domain-containing protein [Anaerolineae bacterium]MDH7472662.1 DUF1015 domain-containing protein [Anaerolineae bacterium]